MRHASIDNKNAVCGCVRAGRVEGVLWYFPYENDQETVPLDPHTMGRMLLMANHGVDAGSTQNPAAAGGLRALTQLGGPTQVAAWQTQRQTQAVGRKGQAIEQDTPELEAAGKTYATMITVGAALHAAFTTRGPSTQSPCQAVVACDLG
jgi:hypothetical protein